MGQTSDELRQEIDQHRQDAAEKIDALQHQMQGTADDLKNQAQDTVDQVKDTVQGTVDDAVEKIQEIDLEGMIRERPLVSLGVGLIGGMIAGGMMRNGGSSGSSSSAGYKASASGSSSTDTGEGIGEKMSDMTDTLKKLYHDSGLEDAINTAASSAMGALTAQITGVVERNLPGAQKQESNVQSGMGSTNPESTWPERS